MSTNTLAELRTIFETHPGPYHGDGECRVLDPENRNILEFGGSSSANTLPVMVSLFNAAWEQHQAAQPKVEARYRVQFDCPEGGRWSIHDSKNPSSKLPMYYEKYHPDAKGAANREAARLNAADTEQQGEAETIMVRGAIRAEQPAEPELPERASPWQMHLAEGGMSASISNCHGMNIITEGIDTGDNWSDWQTTLRAMRHAVARVNAQAGHQRVAELAGKLTDQVTAMKGDLAAGPLKYIPTEALLLARDLLTALNETETTDAK